MCRLNVQLRFNVAEYFSTRDLTLVRELFVTPIVQFNTVLSQAHTDHCYCLSMFRRLSGHTVAPANKNVPF